MSLLNSFNISASGMTAQSTRMDIIAQNIANVNTTRDENGNVYRRQTVVFAEKDTTSFSEVLMKSSGTQGSGVKIAKIASDTESELRKVYDPTHPDADEDGYVSYPNVNTVQEMTDLIDASRSYEANVTAFNATKNMAMKAMDLSK